MFTEDMKTDQMNHDQILLCVCVFERTAVNIFVGTFVDS